MKIPKEEREEGTEEIFEILQILQIFEIFEIMTENFPQIIVRYQTTDQGVQKTQSRMNASPSPQKPTAWYKILKLQKVNDK